MTTQPQPSRFTADQFIAWAIDQTHGRSKLVGGEIVAMAPERVEHARVKFAAAKALDAAIARHGLQCEAMIDGVSVRIDDLTVYEPDVLLRRGEPTSGEATHISDPLILIEVISSSSRAIDSGVKLTDYFRLPSLWHYLVINIEARAVTHYCRGQTGEIAMRILRTGALELDPPNLSFQVEELFTAL